MKKLQPEQWYIIFPCNNKIQRVILVIPWNGQPDTFQ